MGLSDLLSKPHQVCRRIQSAERRETLQHFIVLWEQNWSSLMIINTDIHQEGILFIIGFLLAKTSWPDQYLKSTAVL